MVKAATLASIVASLTVHAGMLVWLAASPLPAIVPLQQVIDVDVVHSFPSAPAPLPQNQPVSPPTLPKQIGAPATQPHSFLTVARQTPPSPVTHALPPPILPTSTITTERPATYTPPVYNAVQLHNLPPEYPERARNHGMQGNVLLQAKVTPEGTAEEVTILQSSGHMLLDDAAHRAICQWHFLPAHRGAIAITETINIPVAFQLNGTP